MLPKILVATSRATINKPADNDKITQSALAKDWVMQELNVNELAYHINQGFPFCTQHDKRRQSKNFIQSNFAALDIDSGMTLAEAMVNTYIKNNALFIYPTASHTAEHNRFRIFFLLDRVITDANEMSAAYTGLIRMFGGDGSCKDPCRMWYGSKDSNPIIFGNVLSNDKLSDVIALGKEKVVRSFYSDGNKKAYAPVTGRAHITLEQNQVVRVAKDGVVAPLASLRASTKIHCPVHQDRRPSAIVTANKHGINGVYCSACALTYWPKGPVFNRKPKAFDFTTITRAVKDMAAEQDMSDDLANVDDDDNLIWPTTEEIAAWHAERDARTCVVTYSKYVPTLPFQEGITMLQSPKGSGKTEWLEKQVAECKAKGLRVLLIGHRQSLLKSMSARVGLSCYFYLDNGKLKNNPPTDYYAICLDSMTKLLKPDVDKYDVVIIDESEQVFAHLCQDTLADKRRQTVNMLFHYLTVAKATLFCDADLGAITVEAAYQVASPDTPVRFHVNEYKAHGETVDLYESEHHLIADVVKAIESGGTHYVATNSREKAKHLQELVTSKFPELKTRLVTSEQATDPETQQFIANIKTEVLDYGLVLASPSLGTGVDITFPENEQKIDTVFGFFYSGVNSHYDLDQQICRVRHPKAIKVWVCPKRFNFETDAEAIRSELIGSREANDAIIGYERTGEEILDIQYLTILSQVTSVKRASQNDLRGNFMRYRESQGWTINLVGKDGGAAKEAGQLMREAKEKVKGQEMDDVISASPLSQTQYDTLLERQKSQKLSKNEVDSMRQYEAARFYCRDVDEDLLLLDDGGKFRDKVRTAELVFSDHAEVLGTSYVETSWEKERGGFASDAKNSALKRKVLRDLMKAAGLADGWAAINPEVSITQSSLGVFVDKMLEYKTKLEHLFGVTLRGDLNHKPISSVQQVLGLLGLELPCVKTQKIGKNKIRYYQVSVDSLEVMKRVMEDRSPTRAKKAVLPRTSRKSSKLLAWSDSE